MSEYEITVTIQADSGEDAWEAAARPVARLPPWASCKA